MLWRRTWRGDLSFNEKSPDINLLIKYKRISAGNKPISLL